MDAPLLSEQAQEPKSVRLGFVAGMIQQEKVRILGSSPSMSDHWLSLGVGYWVLRQRPMQPLRWGSVTYQPQLHQGLTSVKQRGMIWVQPSKLACSCGRVRVVKGMQ